MHILVNRYILFDYSFLFLCGLFLLIGDLNDALFGKILIFIAIFSNIELIKRFKEHDYLIIFLIFSILYWLYLLPYYFFNIPYHYLLQYQTMNYTNFIVIIQVVMLRLMFFGINPNSLKAHRKVFEFRKNSVVYYAALTILFVMLPITIMMTPPSLSGDYSLETKSSSWFEYSIIFILIAALYANTRYKRYLLLSVSVIYMFMPLLYGKRLAFLMLSLLIFNLFFSGKFKLKQILLLVIVGFLFVRFFAMLRVGMSDISLVQFLLGVGDSGVMSNNQGGVVVCSTTYYALIKEDVFDLIFRLKSFIGLFTGIVLPSSLNFEEAYINLVAMEVSNIPGNGGFPSIYLYIWGGFFGVFFGSLLFNLLFRLSIKSRLFAIYMIFVLSTFPRWYAYNMFILLKIGFWLMFFLAIADTFNKYFKKKRIDI